MRFNVLVACAMTLSVSVFLLTGCGSQNVSENSGPDGSNEAANESFRLPILADDEHCELEDPLDACVWAQATDALVIGTVNGVYPLKSPSVLASSGQEGVLLEECEGVVNIGLSIEVTVEQVLRGEAIQAGETVVVKVGFGQVDGWNPQPLQEMNDDLVWQGASEKKIHEGMTLGMGIHYHAEEEIWSLMGEPLFSFDDNGLYFQSGALACRVPPQDWDGMNVSDLSAAVAACEHSDDVDERRELMRRVYGEQPQNFMAGVCISS